MGKLVGLPSQGTQSYTFWALILGLGVLQQMLVENMQLSTNEAITLTSHDNIRTFKCEKIKVQGYFYHFAL